MTGTADTEAEEFAKIYNLDVRVDPDQPADGPQGPGGRGLQDRAREVRGGRRRRSRSSTRRASRCWWARCPSRRARWSPTSSRSAACRTTCSTPSSTSARRTSSRRRAARARSPSPPTWPAAAPTSSWAATPRCWPRARWARAACRPSAGRTAQPWTSTRLRAAARRDGSSATRRRWRSTSAQTQGGARGGGGRWAASSSSAPSGTSRGASTTSCAAAPAARVTRASAEFYLSLEDDLMRIFGSERISGLMERLGMEEGEVIEHKWLSKRDRERAEAGRGPQLRHPQEPARVRRRDEPAAASTIYKLRRQVLAAGAGVPLVEYDEDKKTKVKIRTEQTVSWADFKEMVLDARGGRRSSRMTDDLLPRRRTRHVGPRGARAAR